MTITRRDYFAAAALQGLLAHGGLIGKDGHDFVGDADTPTDSEHLVMIAKLYAETMCAGSDETAKVIDEVFVCVDDDLRGYVGDISTVLGELVELLRSLPNAI